LACENGTEADVAFAFAFAVFYQKIFIEK